MQLTFERKCGKVWGPLFYNKESKLTLCPYFIKILGYPTEVKDYVQTIIISQAPLKGSKKVFLIGFGWEDKVLVADKDSPNSMYSNYIYGIAYKHRSNNYATSSTQDRYLLDHGLDSFYIKVVLGIPVKDMPANVRKLYENRKWSNDRDCWEY